MIEKDQIDKIKEAVEEFFAKMTIQVSSVEASSSSIEKDAVEKEAVDVVDLDVKLEEPQILIGQGGQTLFEIQRLLKMILNKKLGVIFYLNLDINNYKKQKIDFLKDLAKDLADEVVLSKKEKELSPMSSYERRIVHSELSQRADVLTESRGEGEERHIVILPK